MELNEWAARSVRALLGRLIRQAAGELLHEGIALTAAAQRCRRWRV